VRCGEWMKQLRVRTMAHSNSDTLRGSPSFKQCRWRCRTTRVPISTQLTADGRVWWANQHLHE
jgi:hypothetical protein